LYRHLVPLYFAAGVFLLWHQSPTDEATESSGAISTLNFRRSDASHGIV
jgi:hypothetical protein